MTEHELIDYGVSIGWLTPEKAEELKKLLKEQDAVEPMQLQYSKGKEEYWWYESICPKCENRWISMGRDNFCPACGQPVYEPTEEGEQDGKNHL